MEKQQLIVLVGSTASGKSALAVEIARRINGEIISADSRQVYRGLDIGTGKITKHEMRDVPHFLLDVASPKKVFTAQNFVARARGTIDDISSHGSMAIICGGTGFYIDALIGRVALPDVLANTRLRARLDKKPVAELFQQLKQIDSRRARSIDRNNKRRLIRAIEIAMAIGQNPRPIRNQPYDVVWIGLEMRPNELRKRINKRLHHRLQHGMITEAKRLHNAGLSYKRMHDLGLEYRYLARFLQGKISRSELDRELETAIWHYAKRQMTYWRRNKDIRWSQDASSLRILKIIQTWRKKNLSGAS